MAERTNIPVIRETRTRGRSNRKLIFLLVLFFITILLLLFFHSSFSRITSIEISGNVYVSEERILEASGIELNDHYFAVSAEKVRQRVAGIEIIQEAVVSKQFPGELMIEVVEYPEVAYQITPDGRQEAVLANGTALPLTDISVTIDKPILSGWEDQEMKSLLTETLAEIPVNLLTDISEIKPYPSNVYADRILMYTRSYFQIVTTIEKLPEKIRVYRPIIEHQLEQNITGGVLRMLEADTFHPYLEASDVDDEEPGQQSDAPDGAVTGTDAETSSQ